LVTASMWLLLASFVWQILLWTSCETHGRNADSKWLSMPCTLRHMSQQQHACCCSVAQRPRSVCDCAHLLLQQHVAMCHTGRRTTLSKCCCIVQSALPNMYQRELLTAPSLPGAAGDNSGCCADELLTLFTVYARHMT
jgi:hypothetical protein